jgi:YD repeat-containing protein
MSIRDKKGKERLALHAQADGRAATYAYDKDGEERVSAVTQKDGLGGLFVTDADGETLHRFAK